MSEIEIINKPPIQTDSSLLAKKELYQLLQEGYHLNTKARDLYRILGTIKSQIIKIAEASNPYRRKTVKLDAEGYQAVILFKEEKTYSPDAINSIRELLGKDKFLKLFRVKCEYKGNYQALKSFMASATNDPEEIKVKNLIRRAEITTISPPYIKFTADNTIIFDEGDFTNVPF